MASGGHQRQQDRPINYSRLPVAGRPSGQIPRRPVNPAYEEPDPLLSLSREYTFATEKWRPSQAVSPETQSPDHQSLPSQYSKVPSPATPKHKSLIFWWYLEILSVLAAFACLASIVAVLLFYDGKPLNSWPSTILTLNGLIALLSTLHRTFLMVSVSSVLSQAKWDELSNRKSESGQNIRLGNFALFDYAAQGLSGCFQLLWRFKGCHTACIGAFLTIASLVFGVFSQQLISTRIDTVPSIVSADASDVLRTTWIAGSSPSVGQTPIDLGTKASILNGFITNTTVEPPQVNCATGNCTWPIIPTLGICGACVNLTDTLVMEERNSSSRSGGEPDSCLLTAKGGTQLNFCDYEFEIFKVSPGTGQVFAAGGAPIERNSTLYIGDLAAIGADGKKGENGTAAECAFWYCVQARQVSVQDGVLRDTIIDTWTEVKPSDDPGVGIVELTNIPREFNAASDEVYGMGNMWRFSIQSYWNETVEGNVTRSNKDLLVNDGRYYSNSYAAEGLMHNFGNIHDWAKRFAESMTNPLRATRLTSNTSTATRGDGIRETERIAQRTQYQGVAWETQVTIAVRWAWIAYPATVLLLTTVYLAIELVRSARSKGIRPWRSDPLVPLFMTVDEKLKSSIRPGLDHPMGVSHAAGSRQMGVVRDSYGIPIGFHAKQE